jgi:hypothetical protein
MSVTTVVSIRITVVAMVTMTVPLIGFLVRRNFNVGHFFRFGFLDRSTSSPISTVSAVISAAIILSDVLVSRNWNVNFGFLFFYLGSRSSQSKETSKDNLKCTTYL